MGGYVVPETNDRADDAYDKSRQEEVDNALPEVRFSHLRAYGRSAMHGHHARTAPESDPTYAMERGTAVHAILFGTSKVIAYPGAVRRGKEWEAFAAAHDGHEILTAAEYAKAQRMADAVINSKVAAPLLKGVVEETLRFRWNGLDCRATPDVRGAGFITELKSSVSAEPVKFTYQALRMAYHAQMRMQQIAAWPTLAVRDLSAPCYIVCVESTEPHPVTVFEIDKRTLEIGEKLLVLWAERLKQSEESNLFPPYTQDIFPLCAPDDLELEYGTD